MTETTKYDTSKERQIGPISIWFFTSAWRVATRIALALWNIWEVSYTKSVNFTIKTKKWEELLVPPLVIDAAETLSWRTGGFLNKAESIWDTAQAIWDVLMNTELWEFYEIFGKQAELWDFIHRLKSNQKIEPTNPELNTFLNKTKYLLNRKSFVSGLKITMLGLWRYNKKYYYSIFDKIKNWKILSEEELNDFIELLKTQEIDWFVCDYLKHLEKSLSNKKSLFGRLLSRK